MVRAVIYERGPDLFDIELEDGRTYTWVNRKFIAELDAREQLVPWGERQAAAPSPNDGAAWFLDD